MDHPPTTSQFQNIEMGLIFAKFPIVKFYINLQVWKNKLFSLLKVSVGKGEGTTIHLQDFKTYVHPVLLFHPYTFRELHKVDCQFCIWGFQGVDRWRVFLVFSIWTINIWLAWSPKFAQVVSYYKIIPQIIQYFQYFYSSKLEIWVIYGDRLNKI